MTRPARPARLARPAATPVFEPLERRQYLSAAAAPAADAMLTGPSAQHVPLAQNAPATVDAANAQAAGKPLKVYSWHDWHIEGVTPMTWVWMDHTPQQAAAETIPVLQSRGEGDKALFLARFGEQFLDRPLDDILRHGFKTGSDRQWLTTYFGLLKDAGVTPDFIVMDYEDGVSAWSVPPSEVRRVMSDPSLRQLLPESVQQFTAADFDGPRWHDAIEAWNTWATNVMIDGLRQAVRDPARQVFGQDVAMSNWGDANPSTPIYDLNGWDVRPDNAGSVNGWSSVPAYLGGHGMRFEQYADSNWANFVNNLNTVRSLLAAGENVAPWISDASYGGDPQLWAEQLRQFRASGVDTLLLWNPGKFDGMTDAQYADSQQVTRDAFAEVFAMSDAPHELASKLPQLSLGSRDVHTLGYVLERVGRVSRLPVLDAAVVDTGGLVDRDEAVKVALAQPTAVPEPEVKAQATPASAKAQPALSARAETVTIKADRGERRVAFAPIPAVPPPSTPKPAAPAALADRKTAVRITRELAAEAFKFRVQSQADATLDELLKSGK